MYTISDGDQVIELNDFPKQDGGAPLPRIIATDTTLTLVYNIFLDDISQNHSEARIDFIRPRAHMFGPPNDEAISGHPMSSRGLRPYSVFEVRNSSWIAELEKMNRVHERHSASLFENLRHFIFTFHDGTFECIANSYSVSMLEGN